MKKLILASLVSTILVGCGGSDGGSSAQTPPVSEEVIQGIAEMFNYDYNTIELICSDTSNIKCKYEKDLGQMYASIRTITGGDEEHFLVELTQSEEASRIFYSSQSGFPNNAGWATEEWHSDIPVNYLISSEGSVIKDVDATTYATEYNGNLYASSAGVGLIGTNHMPVLDLLINNNTTLKITLGENGELGSVTYDLSSESYKALFQLFRDKNEELYQGI
ncbi:hypothetical protein [Vibrio rotiferianus]|uniref:hypothetical protein n=1 Tax=Vibrio rotiferianus TaxID=190895 RepID=UPI00390A910A